MTPQEQQMIDGLISRIRSTEVQNKDLQAEQHIQQGLAGFPDALYVLAQTVLVQQYGLQQAQSQIGELKQQLQTLQDQQQQASQEQKGSGGSFLSHIFGGSTTPAHPPAQSPQPPYQPVNNPGYSANPGYGAQSYPPPPPPYPPQAYPQAGGTFGGAGGGMFGGGGGMFGGGGGMFGGGGGGGFLQGALRTAAGVAAGEMMFQGMEDLFHGFGGHSERGFGGGGFGGGGETIVNNYNDDARGSDRSGGDSSFYNPSDDASRSSFGDTTQSGSDAGTGDSFEYDNSTADDTSGFDDNSSGDDFSSSDNS